MSKLFQEGKCFCGTPYKVEVEFKEKDKIKIIKHTCEICDRQFTFELKRKKDLGSENFPVAVKGSKRKIRRYPK